MKSNFWLVFLSFFLVSCWEKKSEEKIGYNKGELTILTDDSFKSVVQALSGAYQIRYPETKIKVEVKKEDLVFQDLLNSKTKLIAISKPLSEKEKKMYKEYTGFDFKPDYFAADALVFIVDKNSTREEISIQEIKKILESEDKKIIFDGNNSSNLNFLANYFKKENKDLNYAIINGNENLVKELKKYPSKIGVVSLNTLSREYNAHIQGLRSSVKILAIEDSLTQKKYLPEKQNLKNMTYPFTRLLYFLHNEGGFGISKGVIRYSCTHIGQMVVEKEGLQPYNIFPREVKIKK